MEECPVCLGELEEVEATQLACGHTFCTDCITKWFEQCQAKQVPDATLQAGGNSCPICRQVSPSDQSACVECTDLNLRLAAISIQELGPPVPTTARMHSTPQMI
eukprot:3876015-Pyramimonas_sp.AAC.2